ncbi:MAG: sigma 54-interacting transcriptional regulator [Syntrophobacterales bacterium]|nr:sigma 54-interacting transcriptional regulator [Syntrophobacterales bacterium]
MSVPHLDDYWATVLNTMTDGLMIVDPQGTILAVNRAMESLTGYPAAELVGQPCSILECDACKDLKPQGPGQQCNLFRLGQVTRIRCTLRKKDGTPLIFLKNAAVLRNQGGRVIGGVETLTDLTEILSRDEVICRLRRELAREDTFQGLIGRTPVMRQLFQLLRSAAASEAPVLLTGESGTGKELAAAALHHLSPRARGPFIRVNSAALTESLLESELFGHVKGAFTGADRTRVGRFEAAHGGSIFLDEIGDLPLTTQAKLLRVLQEKTIERVGDHTPIPVDARIITATNQDLARLMAQGRFREDLFYRIGVIPIHLPPLRERREDIPLLAETFIQRAALKSGKAITGLSKPALDRLLAYEWPGNVRELMNVIDYAFVLCPQGLIEPEHLPASLAGGTAALPPPWQPRGGQNRAERRELLLQALIRAGGRKAEAARLLGISRVTLWKWLKECDLTGETGGRN